MQLSSKSVLRAGSILLQIAARPSVSSAAQGLLAGAMLLLALAQFVLTFGVSEPMHLATVVAGAAAMGLVLGLRFLTRLMAAGRGLIWFLFACWLVLLPSIHAALLQVWSEVNLLQSSTSIQGLAFLSSALGLAPGLALVCLLPVRSKASSFGAGLALSTLIFPSLWSLTDSLSPWTLGMGLLASLTGSWILWSGSPTPDRAPPVEHSSKNIRLTDLSLYLPMALAFGCSAAIVLHISRQLISVNLNTLSASWGGGILGFSLGSWFVQKTTQPRLAQAWGALLAALGLVVTLAGFLSLAEWNLWATSWISHVDLLFLFRAALLGGLMFPLGFALGVTSGSARHPLVQLLLTGGVAVGYLLAWHSEWHPWTLALLAGGTFLVQGLIQWMFSWQSDLAAGSASVNTGHARFGRLQTLRLLSAPVMAAAVLVMATLGSTGYRPQQSEKYLFSGAAFTAYRSGIEADLLPFLDDGRLITEIDTVQGRTSIWKHRGMQFALRQNGLPVSWTSGAPELGPDNVAEVVSVLLPLTMHPQAERVLLLGNEGASGLFTALSFPVKEIVNVSPDARAESMLQELAQRSTLGILLEDQRLERAQLDPRLFTLGSGSNVPFDLVISPASQAALLPTMPQFSKSYYLGLKKHLAEQGIVCQRLNYFDLGPEVVQKVVCTLQSVFPQVVLAEATPGELILLATSREQPLFNRSTVQQLKSDHVREILARVGWDWSMVANLGALKGESSLKFSSGAKPIDSSHSIAFLLPREVARWGEKWTITRNRLGTFGESFGNWLGDVEDIDEIQKRLEDIKLARETVDGQPDQFWAYRSALKKRLQDRPRTDIVRARGEGLKYGLHPEDQRRKDYLAALGKSVSDPQPNPEKVRRLNEFQHPYDPLVTYFLHQEAAHLLQRAEQPEPGLQLAHWLHAIYFAPAQDRSVRHICEALRLMHDSPQAVADEAARFDHLNGLLEMLRFRWDMRLRQSKLSRFEATDVEQSIAVTRNALDDMDALCETVGIEPAAWNVRREILEDQLLRPLRVHRSELAGRQIPTPVDTARAETEAGSETPPN